VIVIVVLIAPILHPGRTLGRHLRRRTTSHSGNPPFDATRRSAQTIYHTSYHVNILNRYKVDQIITGTSPVVTEHRLLRDLPPLEPGPLIAL
jgi:hypothetical protein